MRDDESFEEGANQVVSVRDITGSGGVRSAVIRRDAIYHESQYGVHGILPARRDRRGAGIRR